MPATASYALRPRTQTPAVTEDGTPVGEFDEADALAVFGPECSPTERDNTCNTLRSYGRSRLRSNMLDAGYVNREIDATLDLLEEKCPTPTTTTVLDFSPVTNLSSEPPPYYRNRYSSTEYSAALRDFYDLLFDEQFAMCTAWWDTPDNESG